MKAYIVPAMAAAGIAALAIPVATSAQSSAWGYYEPDDEPMQAGVQSSDGGQLILKCDDTGKGEVFAVVVSPNRLRPSTNRPQVRSLWIRFDDGPRKEERWRYYEQSVTALNTSRDQTLVDFLNGMADANMVEIRLEPADGPPFELNFQVTGARDAIARVFESCEDENFVEG